MKFTIRVRSTPMYKDASKMKETFSFGFISQKWERTSSKFLANHWIRILWYLFLPHRSFPMNLVIVSYWWLPTRDKMCLINEWWFVNGEIRYPAFVVSTLETLTGFRDSFILLGCLRHCTLKKSGCVNRIQFLKPNTSTKIRLLKIF